VKIGLALDEGKVLRDKRMQYCIKIPAVKT
jgi:hypothetical protein